MKFMTKIFLVVACVLSFFFNNYKQKLMLLPLIELNKYGNESG